MLNALAYIPIILEIIRTGLNESINWPTLILCRSPSPFQSRLDYYRAQLFSVDQNRSAKQDKFTMIMLTYRRLTSLPKVVRNYCNISSIDKFLIIWNDVENAIPQSVLDIAKQCRVKVQFITAKENKLSNRFQPRPEIETECKVTTYWDPFLLPLPFLPFFLPLQFILGVYMEIYCLYGPLTAM